MGQLTSLRTFSQCVSNSHGKSDPQWLGKVFRMTLHCILFILFFVRSFAKEISTDQTCQCASANLSLNSTSSKFTLMPTDPWPCKTTCFNCTWHIHVDYQNPKDVLRIERRLDYSAFYDKRDWPTNWWLNFFDSKNNSHSLYYAGDLSGLKTCGQDVLKKGMQQHPSCNYATRVSDLYLYYYSTSDTGNCKYGVNYDGWPNITFKYEHQRNCGCFGPAEIDFASVGDSIKYITLTPTAVENCIETNCLNCSWRININYTSSLGKHPVRFKYAPTPPSICNTFFVTNCGSHTFINTSTNLTNSDIIFYTYEPALCVYLKPFDQNGSVLSLP